MDWLAKIQGKVARMSENSLYLDDGSEEEGVCVKGYINDGAGDPFVKAGDAASEKGLAAGDSEGHRLRVRNTDEIVRLSLSVTGIELDRTETSIAVNESVTLTPVVKPENAANRNVIWESSDVNIAAVLNGKVTGISQGAVRITATTEDGGHTAVCNVKVEGMFVPAKGVILDKPASIIKDGESMRLEAVVYPEDATNKNIVWISGNPKVAIVENGVVTGKTAGMTLITAMTEQGSHKANCLIIVTRR